MQLLVEANGAVIPAIGLGTWELRGRACARLVEQALRLGYRHIDTAQIYENEREVWTTHFAPHDLERSTKESLSRLHLTAVDLLLLHWPNPRVPLAETLGALAHVKQLGLARHIGLSNFTVALIEEAVAACPEPLVCDQVEFHPYLDQTKVREACARNGMALVAYSPVAKGRIKGDQALVAIGQAHGKTAAQVCLRWLVQQNVSAIPRTSRVERLSENINIFDFELSSDEMAQISGMGSAKGRLTDFGFAPKWD
jgi:2,5-diketo-D-gluconate reductase B